MDYVDITALVGGMRSTPWSAAEVPEKYFNRMDEARRQLARSQVQVDERAMVAKALKSFKDAGDYDARNSRMGGQACSNAQTYANLRTLMNTEFTKLNRQDSTTARATGHASVNNIVEEMAQATEELVAELTERQGKQVETLMKSTTDALEKLTAAILANKPAASATASRKFNKASDWRKQQYGQRRKRMPQLFAHTVTRIASEPHSWAVLGTASQCIQAPRRLEIC